ncbi:MAG: HNH endonuclease [Phycisphaeraceae bacterium]|nr:HNH endonuclease [Phycisphaeraceae bacterium]
MIAQISALDANVLVLNKLWMAVRVTSARRAFSLLCRGLAEVIHVDDGSYSAHDYESWADLSAVRERFEASTHHYQWVRTVRYEIAVPKVVRLLGYDRLPRQDVKLNRRNIFARDASRCQFCGRSFPTSELTLDHLIPRSQGGLSTWENLVCCCVACNARKGGRTPDQAGMKLVRRPIKPKRNPVITMRLGTAQYASWQPFLDNAYWSVELR